MRRVRLWVGRNRVLTGSAAVLMVLGGKVVVDGQRASRAISRLSTSAPVFAARAVELTKHGNLTGAIEAINYAIELNSREGGYRRVKADVLLCSGKLHESKREYESAKGLGEVNVEKLLRLVDSVIQIEEVEGQQKAWVALYDGLTQMNRLAEASLVGRKLGDYLASKNVDLSAIPKLIEKVESTLIPIPGTGVLMQKTELTVGDWNLYIKARGMPEWEQPNPFEFVQGDDHPVVNVSWNDAVEFCKWLSGVSSSKYRLPYFKERKAASGGSKYPWGVHWPPRKDDGNYAINADGKGDSAGAGVDGVKGTCAVGKFKPNALGLFDLGGNVCEWDIDTHADNNRISGGSWTTGDENHMRMESGFYGGNNKATKRADLGFRVIKEM